MTERTADFQAILKQELAARIEKNSRYSLRAFAKSLQLSPGSLSLMLSGQRVPTRKTAESLARSLNLDPTEHSAFLSSLNEGKTERRVLRSARLPARARARARTQTQEPTELDLDRFHVIADILHYSILELTYVEGFKSDPKWIASQLGAGVYETKLAIERLKKVGLLKSRSGRLVKTEAHLTTADKHVTNSALKRHQAQVLRKAQTSLEEDPIEKRSMTSMTMAIDPEKLPVAKRMIEEFTQSLCEYLETGKRKKVYELGVCLYPIQRG